MRFDHVGVATRARPPTSPTCSTACSTRAVAHEETFDGMSVVFLELDDGGYFELLEPTAGGGAIAGYLDRARDRDHVARSRPTTSRPRSTAPAISDRPRRRGAASRAWGHEVAFLHPRRRGVLVEFVEH